MKKHIHIVLAIIIAILAVAIAYFYFNKQTDSFIDNSIETSTPEPTDEPTPEPTPTVEPTEAPHEHVYVEEVTTEAGCETEGLKTFTCECGESYTEVIPATGHIFENYTYNEDATYLADGTETATCKGCELTDTRTAEGSMLKYTYTPIHNVMYAQQTVNMRDLPCKDGKKIGSLSTNDEVWVYGQCNETGWYKVGYNNDIGYVSDSYLGTEKVVSKSPYLSERNGFNVGDTTTLDNGVTVAYQGKDIWNDVSSGRAYKVTKDLGNGSMWFDVVNPNADSPYISERNGCSVGDNMTLDNGVSVIYQGNDIWLDTDTNTTYVVTKDLGNGNMWFESQVSNTEPEDTTPSNPTHYADDFGYKVGDTTTGYSKGQEVVLEYLGNDRWVDQNGRIWTTYIDEDGYLHWWNFG